MNVICIYNYTLFTFSERNACGLLTYAAGSWLAATVLLVWSVYARCYRGYC